MAVYARGCFNTKQGPKSYELKFIFTKGCLAEAITSKLYVGPLVMDNENLLFLALNLHSDIGTNNTSIYNFSYFLTVPNNYYYK